MGGCKWLDPKCIKFSESSIQYYFQRGAPKSKGNGDIATGRRSEESLQSLLRKLISGDIVVSDVPRIRVIKYEEELYTFDNKRLWVFRQFGEEIPVQIVDKPTNFQLAMLAKKEGDGETVVIIKEPEKKFQSHEFLCKLDLLNRILKWSIRDLLSARPTEEMVPIPLEHAKVDSYMELLSQWLLEETRAQIQQNLLKVSDMACTGVNIDSEIRPIGKKNYLKKLNLRVDHERFAILKRPKYLTAKAYNPTASDIVLLTTFAPQNPGELYQAEECVTLGVVQGGLTGSSFELIILAEFYGLVYAELLQEEKTWYVVKLENLVTCQRIWDSLHQLEASRMAEYVAMYRTPQKDEPASTASLDVVEEAKLQMYCDTIRHLNKSQSEAVKSFIVRLLNREQGFGVELIIGPPGTGKTSTLTAMLSATVCTNARLLVCAPTNTAVNEAARRFLLQKQEDMENYQEVHFCSDILPSSCVASSDVQYRCAPLRLGDIVMLGSEDRLAVEGSVLKKIFLPLRVKRLLAALHPESGWEILSQAFMMRLMEVSSLPSNDSENQKFDHGVLQSLGERLVAHGEALCNDLPTPHLSIRRMRMINAVLSSIRKILTLLASESCNDSYLGLIKESSRQEEVEDGYNEETECAVHDNPRLSQPSQALIVISDDDDTPQFSPNPHPATELGNEQTSVYSGEFIKERQILLEILSSNSKFPIFPESAATSPEWLEAECLESASLVFSTVSTAGVKTMKLGLPFSSVIIDEAAQLVEAESTIITQMKDVKQLVLVGDHKQLPATVMSQLAQKNGYDRSLFERLQTLGHPWRLLDVQYRMHPAISAFPNKQFYNDMLKNGENVLGETYGTLPYHTDMFGPYVFVDVPDGIEENAGSSKRNRLEAELVVHLISRVHNSVCAEYGVPQSLKKPITIGVISPYGGQVGFIRDQISRSDCIIDLEAAAEFLDVEVKSVDGFQGKETDVIIFSAVRANHSGRIGFVNDERRTNVALTRGRHAVWILGSASTLCAHSKLWTNLVEDAKQSKRFFEASQVAWMGDLINNFKTQYKPAFQQKEDRDSRNTRCSELQHPSLPTSPKWSNWCCEEPSVNDGPDWSSVLCLEPSGSTPEVERVENIPLKKRPRSTEWDRLPSPSFATSSGHHDRFMTDAWQSQRCIGHGFPRRSHGWSSYTGQHGWYNRSYNAIRSVGVLSSTSFQVNVHRMRHSWDQPSTWQDDWQPDWDSIT